MKYLIMADFSGQPAPIIFPRRIDHVDMREQLPYGQVISCGTVELRGGKMRCFGGNAELGLSARPEEDAAVLAAALCPGGGESFFRQTDPSGSSDRTEPADRPETSAGD